MIIYLAGDVGSDLERFVDEALSMQGGESAHGFIGVDVVDELDAPPIQPVDCLRQMAGFSEDDGQVDRQGQCRHDRSQGDEADEKHRAAQPLALADGRYLDQPDKGPVPEHDGGDVDGRHQGEAIP